MRNFMVMSALVLSMGSVGGMQSPGDAVGGKFSKPACDDCEVRTMDLNPQLLDGERDHPYAPILRGHQRVTFKSLILVRANFTPELKKSVDSL